MTWTIRLTELADRQIAALDMTIQRRIGAALGRLKADPYAVGAAKALHGGDYRLRVGDWRVIYALRGGELLVLVLRVGHRGEVYRR